MIIKIEIKNKTARTVDPKCFIVCNNDDYEIEFAFDEEWAGYNAKTAYFIANGSPDSMIVFTKTDLGYGDGINGLAFRNW